MNREILTVLSALCCLSAVAAPLKVDLDKPAGNIRRLTGANGSPTLRDAKTYPEYLRLSKQLDISVVRLHDEPAMHNPLPVVDINRIFPIMTANVDDPRNYHFEATDAHIRSIREKLGADVVFQFGYTIEHSDRVFNTYTPADQNKWIKICANIIRHYNEGWNNGFKWNIRYWEIWNEPDLMYAMCFQGGMNNFYPFYAKVAKSLKKSFPQLKIGGPALAHWEKAGRKFLEYCAKNKVPLDFFSYHCYASSPYDKRLIDASFEVRKALDELGYKNTEIHFNEWNYYVPFATDGKSIARGHGIEGAAFVASTLIRLQDSPVDVACHYTIGVGMWGLFNYNAEPRVRYYGFLAAAELNRHPERIAAKSERRNVEIMCGRDKDGKYALLVSAFNASEPNEFEIEFSRMPVNPRVRLLDKLNSQLTAVDGSFTGNTLRVPYTGGFAVLRVDFE